jgi:hypothetical protein
MGYHTPVELEKRYKTIENGWLSCMSVVAVHDGVHYFSLGVWFGAEYANLWVEDDLKNLFTLTKAGEV